MPYPQPGAQGLSTQAVEGAQRSKACAALGFKVVKFTITNSITPAYRSPDPTDPCTELGTVLRAAHGAAG